MKPLPRAVQRYSKAVRKRWMSPYFVPSERPMMQFEVRAVFEREKRQAREQYERMKAMHERAGGLFMTTNGVITDARGNPVDVQAGETPRQHSLQ